MPTFLENMKIYESKLKEHQIMIDQINSQREIS